MCLTPPDTQNMKKKIWGSVRIFRKWDSKCPGFGFAVLGNEYPVIVSETRFDAGISRVKLLNVKEVLKFDANPKYEQHALSIFLTH